MSEQEKRPVDETTQAQAAETTAENTAAAPDTAPETAAQTAADSEAAPAPEAPAPEEPAAESGPEKKKEKEPKDWFNKKARELEALKAKLDAAEKAAAQAKDQLLRTAAEYDNYRKRSTREADNKFNDGVSHAVTQILPILDTLEMAAKALETLHITEIEALGKPFDPNLMNAVQQVPAPDGAESGTVVTVYQKGYRIGERIVRHATVVVAE